MAPTSWNLIGTTVVTIGMVAAVATGAPAATLTVPTTHGSVAAALASAAPGDIIEIMPGTYYEHGLSVRTAVRIRGLGALPGDVVLDAGRQGRVLSCVGVEGPVVLQNLTLRNGLAQGQTSRQRSGGAIFADNCELLVQNCRFSANEAGSHGGAIRFIRAGGRIMQSDFVGNRAALGGGAVDCSYGSSPSIDRCEMRENQAGWGGALSCRVAASPLVTRTLFRANRTGNIYGFGGAVFADLAAAPRLQLATLVANQAAYGGAVASFKGSQASIDECTLAGNSAFAMGAGINCIDSSPLVTRSIIVFNRGTGVQSVGFPLPQLGCSNLFGNSGGNTEGVMMPAAANAPPINADPLFCATANSGNDVYTIAPDSPSAHGPCGVMGAWPAICTLPPTTPTLLVPEVQGQQTIVRWWPVFDHPGARYRLTWSRPGEPERELFVQQTMDDIFLARSAEPMLGDPTVVFRLYIRNGSAPWSVVDERGYASGGVKSREDVPAAAPLTVRNWPNPFNPRTTIGVVLGRAQHTRIEVYDLEGRRVRGLVDRVLPAGETEIVWDGRDERDRAVSAGAYVVKVRSGPENRSHKITLLK